MRRLLLAASLLLAACQVDVEGAACDVPGARTQCPDGQACGLDGKCSERAARCTPCTDALPHCSADGRAIVTCSIEDDPVCGGEREVEACGALVCAAASVGCACPAAGPTIHVDPVEGGTADAAPSGAAEPPGCRFRTVYEGMTAAAAWREAHPGTPATVQVDGSPTDESPLVLGSGDADLCPVTVRAGVTLTTADGGAHAGRWRIDCDPSGLAHIVTLEAGAGLTGFTLRNVSATGSGVELLGVAGSVRLDRVVIEGANLLGTGIRVGEGWSADLVDVEVDGIAGPALSVDAVSVGAVTRLAGGTLSGSVVGIDVRSGKLVATGTAITGNSQHGVFATRRTTGSPPAFELELTDLEVSENDETGIRLFDLPVGSSAAIVGCTIRDNDTTTATLSQHAPTGERAGGVVLWGTPAKPFTFEGNDIRGNAGNQVGVRVSTSAPETWSLSASSCAAANVFGCRTVPLAESVLVYGTGPRVPARNASWPVDLPGEWVVNADYDSACSIAPVCPVP